MMITLINRRGGSQNGTDTAPISRAVNERSVSTLDLSFWTPETQSGAGRLGVCGCMTLSAKETERGRGLSPNRKEAKVYNPPHCFVCSSRRNSCHSATASGGGRVYRGVAALLSLPSDSRSAPVGLEDKRTKCVNPMGVMPSCVRMCIIDG